MKLLVWLFPRAWRRRYGREFVALLEDVGASPLAIVDLLRAAFRAWLHPIPPRAVPVAPAAQWRAQSWKAPGGRHDATRFMEQELVDLLRVVPVAARQSHGDAHVTLICVELYRDGLVADFLIVHRRPANSGPSDFGMPQFRAVMADDVGTDYAALPGGGYGGGNPRGTFANWRTSFRFAPAVPDGTHTLHLAIDSVAWLHPSQKLGELEETIRTPGPWEFKVELK